jgi:bifunctional UDP-N-acetylglucosamine pyrophosphorylase/glucosamine-1-phosphate N-acetyltransferase
VVDQNSQLQGSTSVASGAVIGPDTTLIDTVVGEGATVLRTHSIGAEIGALATVGPFSFLRPGTRMGRKSKVGGFVEAKNAELGEGAKVPHLSYVGDASIGAKANIGAGTIFANYDGVNKSRTTVGEAAFVGSDTVLIAPVEIGPGAYVAAGSAIASDVPSGNLGVTRAPQRNVEGWTVRRRPGTVSAEAAERAAQGPGEVSEAE